MKFLIELKRRILWIGIGCFLGMVSYSQGIKAEQFFSFHGQVIDAGSGFPIEGAMVSVIPEGGGVGLQKVGESDGVGFFEVTVLAAGSYRIRVTRGGYQMYEEGIEWMAGGAISKVIALETVGPDRYDFSFEVVDVTTGVPLSGVPVQVERFNTANEDVAAEVQTWVTDQWGNAVFQGMAGGWYGFRINDESAGVVRPKWEAIVEGVGVGQHRILNQDYVGNVRLKARKQALPVRVMGFDARRNLDQQGLGGVVVEVTGVDPLNLNRLVLPTQTSVTDEFGEVGFTGLPAIPCRVVAKGVGYDLVEEVVFPNVNGEFDTLVLKMELKPTHLFLELRHSYTHPNFVAGLRVQVEGIAGTLTEGVSRAQVTYDNQFPWQRAFFNLLPGKYRVYVNGTTFSGPVNNTVPHFVGEEMVEVIEGVWTDAELPLVAESGKVRGKLFVADRMAEDDGFLGGLVQFGETPVFKNGVEVPIQIVEYAGDGYLMETLRTFVATTDENGEFSVDLLPGRYGIKIPEMVNHWGHSIRLRNLTTTVNVEKDIYQGWPYSDVWPHSGPPPSNSTGKFGNPVTIRSGHEYELELYVLRQAIGIIGLVRQSGLSFPKDSIFDGRVMLNRLGEESTVAATAELEKDSGVYRFREIPPGRYTVTFSAPHYEVMYLDGGDATREVMIPMRTAPGVIPEVDPILDEMPMPFARVDLGRIEATFIGSSSKIELITHRWNAGSQSYLEIIVPSIQIVAQPEGWDSYLYFDSQGPYPHGSFDYWISVLGGGTLSPPGVLLQGHMKEGETKRHEIYWRGGPLDTPVVEYQQEGPPLLPARWTLRVLNADDVRQVLTNITTTVTLDLPGAPVQRMVSGEWLEEGWVGVIRVLSVMNSNWVLDSIRTQETNPSQREFLSEILMRRGTAVRGMVWLKGSEKQPLEGVRVTGRGRFGANAAEGVSGAEGGFEFAQELKSGPIFIEVDVPGYIPWRKRFTSDDAVSLNAEDSELVVEIELEELPSPTILSTTFDRAGIFFPGLNQVGDIGNYSGLTANPALTLRWTMEAEAAEPILVSLPNFDNASGELGVVQVEQEDPISELWMIDPRTFTNRAFQGMPTPLELPSETKEWRSFLHQISRGAISNVFYQRFGVNASTNSVGITNQVYLWRLPEGDFDPVFVAVTRRGAVGVQVGYPYADEVHRLKGVRMPPWLAFSYSVLSSMAAFVDRPERVREVSPTGRFMPRNSFVAAIEKDEEGFLNYEYALGVDWNEGIESPGTGFLQFFPSFFGAKFQSSMKMGLHGKDSEVFIQADAEETFLDLESIFDKVPIPVTPIFKPTWDTRLKGSRQFTSVADPFELEITDEVAMGFEVGATFEVDFEVVPLIGPVLRKLKLGGAAVTGKVGAKFNSQRSWGTRFPAPRPEAGSTTAGLDQVFRRHFAGGKEETSHLFDLCLFGEASVTMELPLGIAGGTAGFRLVGAECNGRPTAKATVNLLGDWPFVTDISGSLEAFVDPHGVATWVKEIGYYLTWPSYNFLYPFTTEPVFQLIPVGKATWQNSPETAPESRFQDKGEVRLDDFFSLGRYGMANTIFQNVLAYSDVDPSTGLMVMKVVIRGEDGEWGDPEVLTHAGGVVDVAVTRTVDGKWLAVWTEIEAETRDNPFTASALKYSVKGDTGDWSGPMTLTTLNGVAAELHLSSSGQEAVLVFLESGQGPMASRYDMNFVSWNGSEWGEVTRLVDEGAIRGVRLEGSVGSPEPSYLVAWMEEDGSLWAMEGPGFDLESARKISDGAGSSFDLTMDTLGMALLAWSTPAGTIEMARWVEGDWVLEGVVVEKVVPLSLALEGEGRGLDARVALVWSEGAPASIRHAWVNGRGEVLQEAALLAGDPGESYSDLSLSRVLSGGVHVMAHRRQIGVDGRMAVEGGQMVELAVPFGLGVRIVSARVEGGDFLFEFEGVPGRRYMLQKGRRLGEWEDGEEFLAGEGLVEVRGVMDFEAGFFRVLGPLDDE